MPSTPAQTALFILTALLILVLPGAAWLAWQSKRAGGLSSLADAVGLSISLTALAALAGFLLDVTFTRPVITTLYAVCLFLLIVGLIVRLRRGSKPRLDWRRVLAFMLGLAGVVGLAAWRLYQARSLALPAWVDSVHHTLVVRLIMENGGLPHTLAPYLPVDFSYHYGFHVLAALFSGAAHTEPAVTLLWFGQILNALVALSVYRLAVEIWADWRRAALAALLVTFGFQMPAYYLTWGRYTLLTGLVVLPLAMAALLRLSRRPRDAAAWASAVMLTIGVALSHYTALLLLGFFTAVLVLLPWFERRQPAENDSFPSRLDGAWQPAAAAAAGVLTASPWLWRVWQQFSSQADLRVVPPVASGQGGYFQYILYLLGPAHSLVWLGVAGAGLIWALIRKQARPLAVWGLLLTLLTLPWGLRLGPFRPDHMAIVLFLPGSLLAADFVLNLAGLAAKVSRAWLRISLQVLLALAFLTGLGWSAWQTRSILNSSTIIVDSADLEALNWVRANTPPDARFMINTTPWMGGVYRGVDGGYWLLPYTARQTIVPPVMYTYGTEQYIAQITDWAERTTKLTTCDADFWRLAEEFDAGYLYLHQGRGSLQPAALMNCPGVVNVYRRGTVFIYQLER